MLQEMVFPLNLLTRSWAILAVMLALGKPGADADPAAAAATLCIGTSSVARILLLFSSSWFLTVKASSMSAKPRVETDMES